MRFWWEGAYEKEWRKNIRLLLRGMAQEEARLSMLKRRRQLKECKVTSNISDASGKRTYNDPVGNLIISWEELEEKITEIETHLNDMNDAIQPLNEKAKEIIKFRYFEKKPWKEVGDILHMDEKNMEVQDGILLKAIRENLTETFLF